MKVWTMMIGPVFVGFVKTPNVVGASVALWPFEPQVQCWLAAPNMLPLIWFNIGRPSS